MGSGSDPRVENLGSTTRLSIIPHSSHISVGEIGRPSSGMTAVSKATKEGGKNVPVGMGAEVEEGAGGPTAGSARGDEGL
jgi:hypothetical protein